MKVIVIGAGIVGVTTAYMLSRAGASVTLIDEDLQPASGTTSGNGAQLCYNYVAPLASPDALKQLPSWLLDPESPVCFRPEFDPEQWSWCIKFLLRCTQSASEKASIRLLSLAMLSKGLMDKLIKNENLVFDYNTRGKLVVYTTQKSFSSALKQLDLQSGRGSTQAALNAQSCIEMEPTLGAMADRLVGGIFTADDHTGDAQKFTRSLVETMMGRIQYFPGIRANSFIRERGDVKCLMTTQGDFTADHYVISSGVKCNDLLRPLGLAQPIYPIRGFSLTASIPKQKMPAMSFTDYDNRIVYAPLGDRLRIAGMADISGYETTIVDERIRVLRSAASKLFPISTDLNQLQPWTGLRPATPDGIPVFGRSKIKNISLNVGHGGLGWTLALATAKLVSDEIIVRT